MGEVLRRQSPIVKERSTLLSKGTNKLYNLLFEKHLFLYIVGFLLGRAVILFEISPFALAFLATVMYLKLERMYVIVVFILFGAWTYSIDHGIFTTVSLVIFLVITYFFHERLTLKRLVPLLFLSVALSRIFIYSIFQKMGLYEWVHLFAESTLTIVLLLIFMQSVPLLSLKRYEPTLKSEELICLIILIASLLTGFIGWEIYHIALEHVFSRYLVLLLAFVGGAAVGSTAGVVAGLVLSLANVANLYQMSLLAFSGLLGGLLKEGKRTGSAFGLLVGSILVGMYGDASSILTTVTQSMVAIILFYFTPSYWTEQLAKLVPGSIEYSEEERKYLQKMRHVTATRIEQFSDVFATLSNSFMTKEQTKEDEQRYETDFFLSNVTEKICQSCVLKKRCWIEQFESTYSLLEVVKDELVTSSEINKHTLHRVKNHCITSNKLIDTMVDEVMILQMNNQLKRQVTESKKIVAEQLKGVSDVMEHFAQEIMEERKRHEKQEIAIIRALKEMDIYLEKMDIYNLEKGNIDIEISAVFAPYLGEGPKLIAPVLSHILDETVVVKEEKISELPHGTSLLIFQSAKVYDIETGVANAAKGGGLISGDSYAIMELSRGKYALAISDGMGNGVRAKEESAETLRLLQQILQTGISEQVAIKSVNSILALRTADEMYATLDLAIINLHNGSVKFLKVGSSPSLIKRGDDIKQLEASNVPIGIVELVKLDVVETSLKHDDLLIMMSDGVYDSPRHIKNRELWLKRKVNQMHTKDPQEIADLLLEEVIRNDFGVVRDDMTILVTKVTKVVPEWSTIPLFSKG